MSRPRRVTTHPAMVFECPDCQAKNIVCMAIAEINIEERKQLDSRHRDLLDVGLQLLTINKHAHCWSCDARFQLLYSSVPFYDED